MQFDPELLGRPPRRQVSDATIGNREDRQPTLSRLSKLGAAPGFGPGGIGLTGRGTDRTAPQGGSGAALRPSSGPVTRSGKGEARDRRAREGSRFLDFPLGLSIALEEA